MELVDLFGNKVSENPLKDRFGIIPFSVLDTKTAEWRQRKQKWINLGIQSELGRSDDLLGFQRVYSKGKKRLFDRKTSVFDPVLCELMYDWFCVGGGHVLDPFSGGSVRGIVASHKDLDYTGIDIREDQVKSNKEQAESICSGKIPKWISGDSKIILDELDDESFDFAFTCPPYFDLEVYSNIKGDISNMQWEEFLGSLNEIIKKTCKKLKNNRFFCIVIGDVRDKERTINWYRNLIGLTKQMIIDAGLHFYNDLILLDSIGTSAMRVHQAFTKRKVIKIHQNILVFYKGTDVNDIRDEFENGHTS
jgi:16S rRNA G966 N2-methylase RsmD